MIIQLCGGAGFYTQMVQPWNLWVYPFYSFKSFLMQIQANIKILYFPLIFFPKGEYIALIVLTFRYILNTSYLTYTHGQKELPHSF